MSAPEIERPVELAHRRSDQIDVWLRWHEQSNIVSIALLDMKTEPPFSAEFPVPSDKANDAFVHPFAYMPEELTQKV